MVANTLTINDFRTATIDKLENDCQFLQSINNTLQEALQERDHQIDELEKSLQEAERQIQDHEKSVFEEMQIFAGAVDHQDERLKACEERLNFYREFVSQWKTALGNAMLT